MATFAFGPVPEEATLLGKRQNVNSSSPSTTPNPAASKARNQRCGPASEDRCTAALSGRGEIIERLIFPDELEATRHPSVVFGWQAQAATHLLGATALVQFAACSASHVLVDRSPDRRVGKESLRLLVDRIRHGLFGCCHESHA